MTIFKITPINNKNKSIEEIIVEANSEHRARTITCWCASEAFDKIDGYDTPECLWHSDALSKCEEYSGSEYKESGKEKILKPEQLKKEWEIIKRDL